MDQPSVESVIDTIFALATGQGRAGVAIIRISGPKSDAALAALAGATPPPRRMTLRALRHGAEMLDRAMVVRFEEGESYTGEAMAELHVHGGAATVDAVMTALGALGLRSARPGEFTRRALGNGRMTLTEVEGLGDLIEAETEAQREQAMRLAEGALTTAASTWRKALIRAFALLEASIDFADEEDAPEDVEVPVQKLVGETISELDAVIRAAPSAARLKAGYVVVLVGPPNVGKSSLANALTNSDRSIVSPIAGTTRDAVETAVDVAGLPVLFVDTAGLRTTQDPVEAIGVGRAQAAARRADLILRLRAPDVAGYEGAVSGGAPGLSVWTKSDLAAGAADVSVSATTGAGLDELRGMIAARLRPIAKASAPVSRERQRAALADARRELGLCVLALGAEVKVTHIRAAIRSLDALVGAVSTEDVLDDVFSRFCIGK